MSHDVPWTDVTSSNFLIPISLKPYGVKFWKIYFYKAIMLSLKSKSNVFQVIGTIKNIKITWTYLFRSVRRHKQAVHEGSKIFPCDRCEYKSTQSGTLKRHIKLVHQKDPKLTEQYENRFSSFSSNISSTNQDP